MEAVGRFLVLWHSKQPKNSTTVIDAGMSHAKYTRVDDWADTWRYMSTTSISCSTSAASIANVLLSIYNNRSLALHQLKRQMKVYQFHIWCVDEQKEHSPEPGAVIAFLWLPQRMQNWRLIYLLTDWLTCINMSATDAQQINTTGVVTLITVQQINTTGVVTLITVQQIDTTGVATLITVQVNCLVTWPTHYSFPNFPHQFTDTVKF